MKLRKINDSDSGILFLSKPINYGDWPLRYFLRVQYIEYWSREWARESGHRYYQTNSSRQ